MLVFNINDDSDAYVILVLTMFEIVYQELKWNLLHGSDTYLEI